MASSDIDQKWVGRIAQETADANPVLSGALFQLLGNSVMLSRRLFRARTLRRLDTSRDTRSLELYHRIIFLAREGLSVLEMYILPYTQEGQVGPEARVLTAKLRASYYHIFCLFHNQPPVSTTSIPTHTSPQPSAAPPTPRRSPPRSRSGSSPTAANRGEPRVKSPTKTSPPKESGAKTTTAAAGKAKLREPISSITSETSFLTNPYANVPPAGTARSPVPGPSKSPAIPPGFSAQNVPPLNPNSFLLPPLNYIPMANTHFRNAQALAESYLPGSHPIRLSVALEHAAFLWDCLHYHESARYVARRAIRDVYRAQEGMDDQDFEDARETVGVLGRFMKRKSWEGTPRPGEHEPPTASEAESPKDKEIRERQMQAIASAERVMEGGPVKPVQDRMKMKGEGSPRAERRSGGSGSGSGGNRSSSGSKNKSAETTPRALQKGSGESPRSERRSGGSKESTPRAR